MRLITIALFVVVFGTFLGLGWYAGADFSVRSVDNAIWVATSLAFALLIAGMSDVFFPERRSTNPND